MQLKMQLKKLSQLLLIFTFLGLTTLSYADPLRDMQLKLKALEKKLKTQENLIRNLEKVKYQFEELNEKAENTRKRQSTLEDDFEAMAREIVGTLEFHGYGVFNWMEKDIEKSTLKGITGQARNGPHSFRAHEFVLISTVSPVKNLKLYSLLEFQPPEKVGIGNLWLEYSPIPSLSLRIGKLFTPVGILNRIHRRNLILTADHTAIGFINFQIFEEAFTGLEAEFKQRIGNLGTAQLMVWLSNGKTDESHFDLDNDKTVGTRVAFDIEPRGIFQELLFGFSFVTGSVKQALGSGKDMFPDNTAGSMEGMREVFRKEGETVMPGGMPSWLMGTGYNMMGEVNGKYRDRIFSFHLKARAFNFTLQTEYVFNLVDPDAATTKEFTETGYYVMLSYEFDPMEVFGKTDFTSRIGRFIPYILYDVYDGNDRITAELGSRRRLVFGINWKISPNVLAKFEFHTHQFVRGSFRDFDMAIAQVVVSF